jgi:hypothetical protein
MPVPAPINKKQVQLEKCNAELEEKLEEKDKVVKSQKSEIKLLRETIQGSQSVEAENTMLHEALAEQRKISRGWETEVGKLTATLQARDAEVAALQQAANEQEEVLQKFKEDEQKREAEELPLKRKRQEEVENNSKRLERDRIAGALNVPYDLSDNAGVPVMEGLLRLQQNGIFCDTVLRAAGDHRVSIHRTVLASASSSPAILERLCPPSSGGAPESTTTPSVEIDLSSTSREAVDLLVQWLYGEVGVSTYQPATNAINEEVLALASDLALPKLCELCCAHFARSVTVSNFVTRVRLCEQYGLPTFRASLVATLLKDASAIQSVSLDPSTLEHPALMRELLAAMAMASLELGAKPEVRGDEVEVRNSADDASKIDPDAGGGRNAVRCAKKGA